MQLRHYDGTSTRHAQFTYLAVAKISSSKTHGFLKGLNFRAKYFNVPVRSLIFNFFVSGIHYHQL